jgi:hypothetical protein
VNTPVPSPLERISQLLAALAAGVGLVYLVGAGVLWIRLWREGLPTDAVITALPRDLLLAVGMRSLIIPAVVLSVVAAAVLVALASMTPTEEQLCSLRTGPPLKRLSALAALTWQTMVATLVIGVAMVVVALSEAGGSWAVGWGLAYVVVVVLSFAIGIVFRGRLRTLPVVALVALSVSLVAAAARVLVELSDPRLDSAKVCVRDGDSHETGLLVGRTADAAFIGQPAHKEDPRGDRIVVIPSDRISQIWIGDKSQSAVCATIASTAGREQTPIHTARSAIARSPVRRPRSAFPISKRDMAAIKVTQSRISATRTRFGSIAGS